MSDEPEPVQVALDLNDVDSFGATMQLMTELWEQHQVHPFDRMKQVEQFGGDTFIQEIQPLLLVGNERYDETANKLFGDIAALLNKQPLQRYTIFGIMAASLGASMATITQHKAYNDRLAIAAMLSRLITGMMHRAFTTALANDIHDKSTQSATTDTKH